MANATRAHAQRGQRFAGRAHAPAQICARWGAPTPARAMERDALADAFADVGVTSLTPDVASDLLSLAVHHGLSTTQLAQMWEAYATRLPAATAATVPRAQVQPFGAFVKKEAPAEEEEPAPAFARTPAFAPQSAAARTPAAALPTPAAVPQARDRRDARHAVPELTRRAPASRRRAARLRFPRAARACSPPPRSTATCPRWAPGRWTRRRGARW